MNEDNFKQYELANYDRVLKFTGERIAHASNRLGRDEKQIRWSEVAIYRTRGNQYVLHKVGKSRVYHAGPNRCGGTSGVNTSVNTIKRWPVEKRMDLAPCPVCQPDVLTAYTSVLVEQDRGVTFVSKTADGVIESAKNEDADGVVYITKVAERALAQAAEVDDDIYDAYSVETIA